MEDVTQIVHVYCCISIPVLGSGEQDTRGQIERTPAPRRGGRTPHVPFRTYDTPRAPTEQTQQTTHTMALSASMAGAGAGGTAMTMNPGMAFGGNVMAAPATFSTFEPPPTAPGAGAGAGAAGAGAGRGGGGGAYDLRSWEKEEEPDESMFACLGIDVGTSSIKVLLYACCCVYV